ncbi:probable zinc metalloprotease Rip3 [Coccomyxa sp. Obi]|nr:probable zinc metalloprotease Rip3 [Coccomyxa sp. Obi]
MADNFFTACSIPLGSLFGIPVRLHLLFILTLFLAILSQAYVSAQSVGWAVLLFGPILLLTVYIHELGHCWASRKVGAEVHGILLWPLGGLAFVGHTTTPKKDAFVSISGPLTHIPQFLIWFAILAISSHVVYHGWSPSLAVPDPRQHFWLALCAGASQLNIYLMAFNLLLPAYPLDGGRIFADLLLMCGVNVRVAAIVTVVLAVAVAGALIAWGIIEVAILTVAVGIWMLYTSAELGLSIKNGTVAQHPMFCYESLSDGANRQPTTSPEVMLPANQPRSAAV